MFLGPEGPRGPAARNLIKLWKSLIKSNSKFSILVCYSEKCGVTEVTK